MNDRKQKPAGYKFLPDFYFNIIVKGTDIGRMNV